MNLLPPCPFCGADTIARSLSITRNIWCANGHAWHRCMVHQCDVAGTAARAAAGCTCENPAGDPAAQRRIAELIHGDVPCL